MKKLTLFLVTGIFIVLNTQIVNSQGAADEKFLREKTEKSGPEFLIKKEKVERKDFQVDVRCIPVERSEEEAKLIEALKEAKQKGDEDAARSICLQLGWAENQSSRVINASPSSRQVIRESLAEPDRAWQGDVPVSDPVWSSAKPAMAAASDGTLYVVVDDLTSNYLDVYRSMDDGQTWPRWFSIGGAQDRVNPSIAIGEGNCNRLLIAYIEGAGNLQVFWVDLDTLDNDNVLVQSNTILSSAPRICVDSPEYSYWYPYIVYTSGGIDIPWSILFFRSTDYGNNWSSATTLDSWSGQYPPDIDFGDGNLYVVYTDEWSTHDTDVFMRRSTDLGSNWDSEVTLAYTSYDEYDPRVAATNGGNAVVVAYTKYSWSSYQGDIEEYYSTNKGDTWYHSTFPYTSSDEKTVDLCVEPNLGKIHAVFWRGYDIQYTWADYTSPGSWASSQLINEENWASSVYPQPTITVNPTQAQDRACIAWTDYRSTNYQVYFDAAYPRPVDWTFMVYLDGDCDMELAAINQFLKMAEVGSDAHVNIVVQFDRWPSDGHWDPIYGDWKICHRFYLTHNMEPIEANAIADWGDGSGGREVNMGDPQTLIDFAGWAMTTYPASQYALVLVDHGGGWRTREVAGDGLSSRAVIWDDSSGDCLFMKEVQTALSTIENDNGQVDLVGFDACLMAMAEVGYEIKDHAWIMVGSEPTESHGGWPYNWILEDLTDNPGMYADLLGMRIVERYKEAYEPAAWNWEFAQSACNLYHMSNLAGAVSVLANLMKGSPYKTQIAAARSASQDFCTTAAYPCDQFQHVDLYHFADLISTGVPNAAIQTAANNVKNQVWNAVVHEWHKSTSVPDSYGLAIYFPRCPVETLSSDYNGSVIDFARDTQWDEFLTWYCAEPPEIQNISFDGCISELCKSDICVTAYDPSGGNLSYNWTVEFATIVGSGSCVQFDPRDYGPHVCPYVVWVTVSSNVSGLSVTQSIPIYVKLAGDVDGNGVVNVIDKVQVRNHFGESGDPGWIDADVDCSGGVNVLDKVKVRNQFGLSGCACPQ